MWQFFFIITCISRDSEDSIVTVNLFGVDPICQDGLCCPLQRPL